jgi:hypothetical protein
MYPQILPRKVEVFNTSQSKYSNVDPVPFRSLLLGPSGSGKSTVLQSMILDIYAGVFQRIYIWSPSVFIDPIWVPVRDYLKKVLHQDEIKEKTLFDHYNESDLDRVISTQFKVVEHQKQNKQKHIFSILVIVDDFADSPSFTRNSKLLHSLYTRGRHVFIPSVTATQVYKAISPIIRKNLTSIYMWKLRNWADHMAWLEELAAMVSKEHLEQMYQLATSEPYGFLYIHLTSKSMENMFWISLRKKLVIKNVEDK